MLDGVLQTMLLRSKPKTSHSTFRMKTLRELPDPRSIPVTLMMVPPDLGPTLGVAGGLSRTGTKYRNVSSDSMLGWKPSSTIMCSMKILDSTNPVVQLKLKEGEGRGGFGGV